MAQHYGIDVVGGIVLTRQCHRAVAKRQVVSVIHSLIEGRKILGCKRIAPDAGQDLAKLIVFMTEGLAKLDEREVLARKSTSLEKVRTGILDAKEGCFFLSHDRRKLREIAHEHDLQCTEWAAELAPSVP